MPRRQPRPWAWLGLIAVGVLLRFAISAASIGSTDERIWQRLGQEINQWGLLRTYHVDRDFNHPPLAGCWAAVVEAAIGPDLSVESERNFASLFKLPAILADCIGIYLLWLIWRGRSCGPASALTVAALFACSLDAILVSAYHCNTDSVFVMLCLLSLYLIEQRRRWFWGGIALGAAINVKILPVLLLPGIVLSCRSWKELARFLAALAICALPFVPPLLLAGGQFLHNALQYNSYLDRWGVSFFFLQIPRIDTAVGRFALWYFANARYVILALIVAWAIAARLLEKWSRYEIAAASFAIFLVLTPGFGVQYTAMVGLLLFAVRPMFATAYGFVAGLFLGTVYFLYWTGSWPAYSEWRGIFPDAAAYLGLAVWALLIAYLVVAMIRPVLSGRDAMP